MALAGGVTITASPEGLVEFSAQRVSAPDGRCKSFADGADGAGFSEGLGVLLLERLSDAQRLGHRVLGVVRGSAVNQDGASNGLTAPNGPSQQRVIRQALTNARLSAVDVDVVEAHGTGTVLGDPIEAQALLATYGQGRERPLWLGSVKSNIGHTAAAAGVAGVIKMVMAMRHGVLPKTLHVGEPSTHVDWSAGPVSLLTEQRPWLANGEPRRAGVSSFGISGTNAHVILEEAPLEQDPASDHVPEETLGPSVLPCVISAKSPDALLAQAERLSSHVRAHPELAPADLGATLALHRAAFSERAAILAENHEQLLEGLDALTKDRPAANLIRGHGVAAHKGKVVFIFPGQGSQWQSMALELLEQSSVFAQQMLACEEALASYVDWSLGDVLRGAGGAPTLDRVDVVQPALFAVMVSLAELWRSYGVTPDLVIGHSQGESAAAYVAGGLSLDDAARVVALRSKVIARLTGYGVMVSVAASQGDVRALIEPFAQRVSVAAINSPDSLVLACDRESADAMLARCEVSNVRAREIPATVPTHSAYVEQLRDEVLEVLSPVNPRSSEIAFYSTAMGEVLDTANLDSDYWYTNMRETVRFEEATRALIADGYSVFIEVSPHPVLTMALEETIDAARGKESPAIAAIGSLSRHRGDIGRFFVSLSEAYTHGVEVDWRAVFGTRVKPIGLPTYAFQRKRYWLKGTLGTGDARALGLGAPEHPFFGAALQLAGGQNGSVFTGRLSVQSHPWLKDHALMDRTLLPGTGFIELALAAAQRTGAQTIEELTFERPLFIDDQVVCQLQLTVSELDDSGRREARDPLAPRGPSR